LIEVEHLLQVIGEWAPDRTVEKHRLTDRRIQIEVAFYGPIARFAGGQHLATLNLDLTEGATVGQLLDRYGIPEGETGYVFVNAILCDVPGLFACKDYGLHDGDHVGIFSTVYMWPYQYRDGARMSEALRLALENRQVMRHSYQSGNDPA
jgi:molybdopterin converting factor small subunit